MVLSVWHDIYSVQCESKNAPWRLVAILPKRLGIFQPNFTSLLCLSIYARLRTFIQLSATLTKLYHIKRDHPVHIMCAICPPSAETHAGIFWSFPKTVRNFYTKFYTPIKRSYARMQIFIQLSPTVTKLCHIKCDHPACVSVDGGHFEHIMVVALNIAYLRQSCR